VYRLSASHFFEAVRQHSPQHVALFLCAIHASLHSGELAGVCGDCIQFRIAAIGRNVGSGPAAGRSGGIQKINRIPVRCLPDSGSTRGAVCRQFHGKRRLFPLWVADDFGHLSRAGARRIARIVEDAVKPGSGRKIL